MRKGSGRKMPDNSPGRGGDILPISKENGTPTGEYSNFSDNLLNLVWGEKQEK